MALNGGFSERKMEQQMDDTQLMAAPKTVEDCRNELDHIRRHWPDFDELHVDAIDPVTDQVAARLYLQFRAPFRSRRQEGYEMTHQDPSKAQKWSYNFSITEDDPPRVLHEFNTKYSGMKLVPSLSYSELHDKARDAELRRQVEQAADRDAALNERIEIEMNRQSKER